MQHESRAARLDYATHVTKIRFYRGASVVEIPPLAVTVERFNVPKASAPIPNQSAVIFFPAPFSDIDASVQLSNMPMTIH